MNIVEHGIVTLLIGTGAIAVAQGPPQYEAPPVKSYRAATPTQQPKRLKINISINDLKDLKVREGDRVSIGQVLADRDNERKRLNSEKQEILNTIAFIEQTPRPLLKTAPPLTELPLVSYAEEEAAIQQADLKFSQAQRNYTNTLSNDPFITARANVDFARAGIEQAYREVELQQKKLEAIAQIQSLPPEMLQRKRYKSNFCSN
jgi:multidrug efflux pump subunit AcrA (membrane-fusion protein)